MYGRRRGAADVHVRDAGAVRGLAAQQAAAGRAGRLPRGAGAQGNAPRAAPAAARAGARAPPGGLGPAASPQLPGRAALPQLLLTASSAPSPSAPRGTDAPARSGREPSGTGFPKNIFYRDVDFVFIWSLFDESLILFYSSRVE